MAADGHHRMGFLESVRGVAALAVVFHHLTLTFWPWVLNPSSDELAASGAAVHVLAMSPVSAAIDGRTPVAVFFVLSGFVLALSHLRAVAGSPAAGAATAAGAAARRYVRLAGPILGSVVISYVLIRLHAYPTPGVVALVPETWLMAGYQFVPPRILDPVNGVLAQGLYGVLLGVGWVTYDNVSWTMPIELAGSYLVFAFLALFGSARHRWLAYAAVGCAVLTPSVPMMLQFLLGTAMADAYLTLGPPRVARRAELRWTVWPLLAVAAGFAVHRRVELRGFDLLPLLQYHQTVGAALFVALPLISSQLRRTFNWRPLVWLGRVSFGLYLTHGLVIASAGAAIYLRLRQRAHWSHDAAATTTSVACLALSLVAGWVFHHAIDRPSVAAARKFGKWFQGMAGREPRTASPATPPVAADVAAA